MHSKYYNYLRKKAIMHQGSSSDSGWSAGSYTRMAPWEPLKATGQMDSNLSWNIALRSRRIITFAHAVIGGNCQWIKTNCLSPLTSHSSTAVISTWPLGCVNSDSNSTILLRDSMTDNSSFMSEWKKPDTLCGSVWTNRGSCHSFSQEIAQNGFSTLRWSKRSYYLYYIISTHILKY